MTLLLALLAGFMVATVINLLSDWLPSESVEATLRTCPSCGRSRSARALLPFVGLASSPLHCRVGGEWIGPRRLLVDLTAIGLFVVSATVPLAVPGWLIAVWGSVYLLVTVIDVEHRLILNIVSYPAIAIALLIAFTGPEGAWQSSAFGAVAGLGVFGLIYLGSRLLYPGKIAFGLGDVKLAALIGAICGFPLVVSALALGILVGGLGSIGAVALGIRGRKDYLPYGPYLAFGGFVTLIYGDVLGRILYG